MIRPDAVSETREAYNIAPTQEAPIIREHTIEDGLELAFATWGLVPRWWKKPLAEKKFPTFNARGEDVATTNSFRSSFKDRPCLVPMSGYYEWKGAKGSKQAYAFGLRNRRLFYVAGLWDRAYIDNNTIDSFTIVTTAPNEVAAEVHNRMPLIPEQSSAKNWINATPDQRLEMIKPYSGGDLHVWKVGPDVGNVRNQGEQLIAEVE